MHHICVLLSLWNVLVYQQGNSAAMTLDCAQVTKCANKETNSYSVAPRTSTQSKTSCCNQKDVWRSCGDRCSSKNCCNQDRYTLENLLDEKTCANHQSMLLPVLIFIYLNVVITI